MGNQHSGTVHSGCYGDLKWSTFVTMAATQDNVINNHVLLKQQ